MDFLSILKTLPNLGSNSPRPVSSIYKIITILIIYSLLSSVILFYSYASTLEETYKNIIISSNISMWSFIQLAIANLIHLLGSKDAPIIFFSFFLFFLLYHYGISCYEL